MSNNPTSSVIALAAGGTGGHFFPALALAQELERRGHSIALLTDERIKPQLLNLFSDYPHLALPSSGIVGHSRLYQLRSGVKLLMSAFKAISFLKKHRVRAVVGFGGYPSVPPILGGWMDRPGRPALIIHEGNARMGRANRLLARLADVTALSFSQTKDVPQGTKTAVTGMPIRSELVALASRGHVLAPPPFNIVVWGGSLGAHVFSQEFPQALAQLPLALRKQIKLTQQVRTEDLDKVAGIYKNAQIQADIRPFFDDVGTLLSKADLVVGRAGGSSVAELLALGVPSLLIPFPNAAGNEQSFNARFVEENGGGWMMDQKEFRPAHITSFLEGILKDPSRLSQASRHAKGISQPRAASALADLIEQEIANHQSR